MFMNAQVLEAEVRSGTFYDPMGVPRTTYTVSMKVLDDDTNETYAVQLSEGFPHFEELKELRRQGAAEQAFEDVVTRFQQELPVKGAKLSLEVLKFKGKSAAFMTLVCRFAQVAVA